MFSESDFEELDVTIYRLEREHGCRLDILRRAYDELRHKYDEAKKTEELVHEILEASK